MPNTALLHTLDKYVKYEYNEQDFIITFIIQLPNEGQYGLDIYARDPEYQTEKRTMSHCCKYIINYSTGSVPSSSSAVETTKIHNHMYHDYSFDSSKSNEQQINSKNNDNKPRRSLSPCKYLRNEKSSMSSIRYNYHRPWISSNDCECHIK